jgi:hypothetical protein
MDKGSILHNQVPYYIMFSHWQSRQARVLSSSHTSPDFTRKSLFYHPTIKTMTTITKEQFKGKKAVVVAVFGVSYVPNLVKSIVKFLLYPLFVKIR